MSPFETSESTSPLTPSRSIYWIPIPSYIPKLNVGNGLKQLWDPIDILQCCIGPLAETVHQHE